MNDRDKGLRPAGDGVPLATRDIYLGHMSRNLQESCLGERKTPNSAIHFALAGEELYAGMDELQGVST